MRRLAAALLLFAVAGCGEDDDSFSQFPGFEAYFAAHPPEQEPPADDDAALLARYRPRIFLPPGHDGPVSFYDDYIASGTLTDGSGRVVSDRVTRAQLNAHRLDTGAVFVHEPRPPVGMPVVFGRVDTDVLTVGGERWPFTFLTYHLVFRSSGLSRGLPGWLLALADLVADADDWHQLDHYTSVILALAGDAGPPAAMTLQQHNYLRTYILDQDAELPADGRVAVDVALGSNELYPHDPEPRRRRAAASMSAATLPWLVHGGDEPLMATMDLTHGAVEIGYRLEPLAPADAFYTFRGWLGERRLLPGRDGPPGADYNTLPALKPPARQLVAFFWRDGDQDYVDLAGRLTANWREGIDGDALERLGERFLRAWRCGGPAAGPAAGCGEARAAAQ